VTPSVVSSTTGHAQRRFDVRNTAHSTFKDMQVRQSREPFCSSDKFHPLSAAWAKRWRRRGIVSVFVAHKRNSVFEPLAKWDWYITWELLRGYREIAERLIFGNRRSCGLVGVAPFVWFLHSRNFPQNLRGGIAARMQASFGGGGGSVAKRKLIAPGRSEQQTTTKRDQTTTNKHCIAA
jgi:hypothetical protein